MSSMGLMIKKILFTAFFASLCAVVHAQSLSVTPDVVQMGEIALKSKNRVELICVNLSDKPLVIRDIQTDCTCTKPAWSKSPVMPGDSVRITVTLTPTDRGAFYKTVRFITVPASEKVQQAVLRGKVY